MLTPLATNIALHVEGLVSLGFPHQAPNAARTSLQGHYAGPRGVRALLGQPKKHPRSTWTYTVSPQSMPTSCREDVTCGKGFKAHRKSARYCSRVCEGRAYRERVAKAKKDA